MDPFLYVWRNSDSKREEERVIAGVTCDYHIVQMIGDGILNSTLLCNYRDSPAEFQMLSTAYVSDIDR